MPIRELKRGAILVLLVPGILLGYVLATHVPKGEPPVEAPAKPPVAQSGNGPARQPAAAQPRSERAGTGFTDLSAQAGFPPRLPRNESPWQVREKAHYSKLLSAGTYDLLVVPFQVNGYAFSRSLRSLMTAELALGLRDRGHKVPDPYLLLRALGENQRQLDDAEVTALARALGVKEVIWTHIGHDRNFRMDLLIQRLPTGQAPRPGNIPGPGVVNRQGLAFSLQEPPGSIFHANLGEILNELDPTGTGERTPAATGDGLLQLADSPVSMFSGGPGAPMRDAQLFQWLAYLTPEYEERTREIFAEKSLLALYRASTQANARRLLVARAYKLIGLRPAAISAISNPGNSAEKALLEALNGNLPELRAHIAQIEPGLDQDFAILDANSIATTYGVTTARDSLESARSMKLPGAIWPFLAARAMVDWDLWSQFDNYQVKQLLDVEVPAAGYSADSIISGAMATGKPESIQAVLDLSVLEHVGKLMDTRPEIWCCEVDTLSPGVGDYLELISAIGTSNLMRRARFLTHTQGSPNRGREFLNSIEGSYDGYPEFAFQRARADQKMAEEKTGVERESLVQSTYRDSWNAFLWSGGQTLVAAFAFDAGGMSLRHDYGRGDNPYAADYPYNPLYTSWESGGNPNRFAANSQAKLDNSTCEFHAAQLVLWANRNDPGQRQAVLESLKGRFNGSPDYDRLLVEESLKSDDLNAAERALRESISSIPDYWDNYMKLGELLVENGRGQEAFDVFISWPGFRKDSKMHSVGVSGSAYVSGSLFYWSGQFDLAKPLYRIASDLQTGSEGSLSSAIRLEILEGNFGEAMEQTLARANRYNSPYAFRDYLGMLHAFGKSTEAWDAFNSLAHRSGWVNIWEAALVGHRIQSASESEIAEWLVQYRSVVSKPGDSYAALYQLRAGVTDRVPSAELATGIENTDQPVMKLTDPPGHVFRDAPDKSIQNVVGPRITGVHGSLPLGWSTSRKTERVRSDLAYFADAYRSIRMGEFARASDLLGQAVALYNLGADRYGYLLPYYAYAAARTGKMDDVKKVLEKFEPELRRFDYHLAQAVLSAAGSDDVQAAKHLDRALYTRPHTETRPLFTEYQYAELCELLFEFTGRDVYRERIVDWSRKAQQFFPWNAWPYPMLALYTDDAAERKRAIVMGHYLDPGSERLKAVPDVEVREALKDSEVLNPFKSRGRAGSGRESI